MKSAVSKAIGMTAVTMTLLVAGAAHALDVRSWDQKINDATKRFVVLPAFDNQAVLDKETQLVWQRYVSNVADFHWNVWRACARAKIGGRMGWRLPTLAELTSLVDPAVTSGVKLSSGHPFLMITGYPIPASLSFWSSTFDRTSPQDPTSMATYRYYSLDIDTGDIEVAHSVSENNFICVRGPDPANAD